jgi:hypothetical protein
MKKGPHHFFQKDVPTKVEKPVKAREHLPTKKMTMVTIMLVRVKNLMEIEPVIKLIIKKAKIRQNQPQLR